MPGLLLGLSAALILQASPAASSESAAMPVPRVAPGNLLVERDTPIRLMVVNEVSTRTAKPGDRFMLRVDENVVVEGVTIIPAGTRAWGEVSAAEKSGAVGKSGKLQARLLHVEVGGEQIPISGENKSAGDGGGTQVVLGALALGPLALLAPGNNAKLKAGDIFSAYFDADLSYDPAASRLSPIPTTAPVR